MKYLMRSGALLNEAGALVCRLQRFPLSTQKQIYHSDGTLALQVEIRQKQTTPENRDQAWHHDYIMASPQGDSIIRAQPDYAQGEDPRQIGWPLCRMPRVDHADLSLNREQYRLVMHNSQNYALEDTRGRRVVQILHRGITGGWSVEAGLDLKPEVLCGLFVFCRYLERENEFITV